MVQAKPKDSGVLNNVSSCPLKTGRRGEILRRRRRLPDQPRQLKLKLLESPQIPGRQWALAQDRRMIGKPDLFTVAVWNAGREDLPSRSRFAAIIGRGATFGSFLLLCSKPDVSGALQLCAIFLAALKSGLHAAAIRGKHVAVCEKNSSNLGRATCG